METPWRTEPGIWVADAFCGEGGSGKGIQNAGYRTVGIDNDPARLALYPGPTIQTDAVDFLAEHGHEFAWNWGSPTCTGYSRGTVAINDRLAKYDRLIGVTREAMLMAGRPYIIENVEDAKSELIAPLMLCGRQFGLEATDDDGTRLVLDRHRMFESNVMLMTEPHPWHDDSQVAGAYGGARRDKVEAREVRKGGYVPKSLAVLRELLGTPWMTERGCFLSIPPVYSQCLAEQMKLFL